MPSIKSMRYAIMKTSTGWIEKTANEILELREIYGDDSPEYLKIKERFRCKGCYDTWKKVYKSEPPDNKLPKLTHYNRHNSGGTHFQLSKNIKHKVKGCYYDNPSEFIKELSYICEYIQMGEQGRAKLSILNPPPSSLNKNDTKGISTRKKQPKSSKRMSFNFLQETHDRYKDGWIELPVETEDGEKKKIGDLIVSPKQAKIKAKKGETSICIVMGTIKKVMNRNRGGYLHILVEDDVHSSIFKLFIEPNHIYNENDLKSLKGRKIGCYGRIHWNTQYPQMELFSIDQQIVFVDLNGNRTYPIIIPQIKIERVYEKALDVMNLFNVTETSLDSTHFNYYISRQQNTPTLNEQILLYKNEIEKHQKSWAEIKRLIKDTEQEKNYLDEQLEVHKVDRTLAENNLKTEQQRKKEKIFKFFKRNNSYKVQELLKIVENLNIVVYQLQEKVDLHHQKLRQLLLEETRIEHSIKRSSKGISGNQNHVQLLIQGLKWEEAWKQDISSHDSYIYHKVLENKPRDLLIGLQVLQYPDVAEVNIKCFIQQHEKNEPTKLFSNIKGKEIISIHPMDLHVYQTFENKLKGYMKKILS
ncbi:hypothetical protein [Priestia endophytica]|uniref:hypothetical protein n=1 Tax=Priestia endophytica TaxID=135735 RepID=UPI000F549FC9|nr:hypothetical protein [Priestia endophytica]RPK08290.1 hypothetical protein FH5_04920 [Priestia endophytica]